MWHLFSRKVLSQRHADITFILTKDSLDHVPSRIRGADVPFGGKRSRLQMCWILVKIIFSRDFFYRLANATGIR